MFHTLRIYEPRDREQVIDLDRLALSDIEADGLPTGFKDLECIEKHYMDNGTFVVVEHEEQIVGMGGMRYLDDNNASIHRMRVHPDYQRMGIAQLILNWLELEASNRPVRKIVLNTLSTQKKAQLFYESQGYSKVSEGKPDGFEVFMYEKQLCANRQSDS